MGLDVIKNNLQTIGITIDIIDRYNREGYWEWFMIFDNQEDLNLYRLLDIQDVNWGCTMKYELRNDYGTS